MPDKDEPSKNQDAERKVPGQRNSEDPAVTVPNPFEADHAELSPEALDSLEQFKEAQTERD